MRIFPPLPADHPSVTKPTRCLLCNEPFQAGDETTLIAVRPAGEEDAQKAAAGHPYNAEAELVHVACCEEVVKQYILATKDHLQNEEQTNDHESHG